MAAMMGRTEIGIKKTGVSVNVPNNPKAKLMYYLNSICSVLDMSDTDNISRLRNYNNYNVLSEREIDALVTICLLLSPDELVGKVIFQNDAMCGDSPNEFYEISAVSRNLLVANSIMIGGQRRSVSEVMFFKQSWIVNNWIDPMKHFTSRLQRIAGPNRARSSRSRCLIM